MGLMQVYEWESGAVVWRSDWGGMLLTPYGFTFADDAIYVADLEGPHIFVVDLDKHFGALRRRISHPAMNDLHSLERTRRGLLVASSGTDALLEVDLDGRAIWEWWAAEHGYDMTPAGVRRPSGRNREHRPEYYHTRFHATHVNSAVVDGDDDRFVLALLFHQGQLVRIDRSAPLDRQVGDVVMDGLMRPHSLERIPNGWLFANSVGGGLVLLDEDLSVSGTIPYAEGWIQSCTRISDGRILLNDVDNYRIVEFASGSHTISRTIGYDTEWRMAEMVEVPPALESFFLAQPRAAVAP